MKKSLIPKILLKKLHSKAQKKASRALERRVRSSLLEQAQKLTQDLSQVQAELTNLPARVSEDWVWLADIRRASYMMEQVVEMLQGAMPAAQPQHPEPHESVILHFSSAATLNQP